MEALKMTMETPAPNVQGARRYIVLSQEEEARLIKRFQELGDVESAQTLVTANIKNVAKIARGFISFGVPLDDLIQEGNLGLMIAISRFKADKGNRLMTYAAWWIRAKIVEVIMKDHSIVRISKNQTQQRVFSGYKKFLQEEHAQEKSLYEQSLVLSERFDLEPQKIEEIITRYYARDCSLDAPLTEDGEASFLDHIEDEGVDLEKAAIWNQGRAHVRRKIENIMALLPERERDIVVHRFMAENPMTLQELAEKHALSKERIRQIEERLKERLKIALARESRLLACN